MHEDSKLDPVFDLNSATPSPSPPCPHPHSQTLEDSEIDQLSVVAVAGIAAEGQQYEEVRGRSRLQLYICCGPH